MHPLSFDENNKFQISAGSGYYKSENAFALGAFYQPNEDVIISFGSTIGSNDNMYNAGATWRVGHDTVHKDRNNTVAPISKVETLEKTIAAQEEKIESQELRIQALETLIRQMTNK